MKSYTWYLGRIQGVVDLTEESGGNKEAAYERIAEIVRELKAAEPDHSHNS